MRMLPIFLALAAAVCAPRSGPSGEGRVAERERMVAQQIAARGVHDPRVLAAMRRVPRHEFVPADQRGHGLRRPPAARSATARPSRSPTSWAS